MVYTGSGIATGGGIAAASLGGMAMVGYVVLSAALLAAAFGVWRLVPKRHRI